MRLAWGLNMSVFCAHLHFRHRNQLSLDVSSSLRVIKFHWLWCWKQAHNEHFTLAEIIWEQNSHSERPIPQCLTWQLIVSKLVGMTFLPKLYEILAGMVKQEKARDLANFLFPRLVILQEGEGSPRIQRSYWSSWWDMHSCGGRLKASSHQSQDTAS